MEQHGLHHCGKPPREHKVLDWQLNSFDRFLLSAGAPVTI